MGVFRFLIFGHFLFEAVFFLCAFCFSIYLFFIDLKLAVLFFIGLNAYYWVNKFLFNWLISENPSEEAKNTISTRFFKILFIFIGGAFLIGKISIAGVMVDSAFISGYQTYGVEKYKLQNEGDDKVFETNIGRFILKKYDKQYINLDFEARKCLFEYYCPDEDFVNNLFFVYRRDYPQEIKNIAYTNGFIKATEEGKKILKTVKLEPKSADDVEAFLQKMDWWHGKRIENFVYEYSDIYLVVCCIGYGFLFALLVLQYLFFGKWGLSWLFPNSKF
nr:MAG TPA: hypothetical protein [Caudoviricetes sp.]